MKKIYDFKACIIFFTGISASGKSTLCLSLQKKFKKLNIKKIKNIDGDFLRNKLKNFNYEKDSRDKIGNIKMSIAKNFLKKGNIVLVSGIAHNKEWRKKIKEKNKDYFEIFVKCPLKTCEKRDYKFQYTKAKSGEIKDFIGISEPYQIGKSHDLIINTSRLSVSMGINKVFNFHKKKNYVFTK